MTAPQIEVLDWDSSFFGLKIGRMNFQAIDIQFLSMLPSIIKNKEFNMVYLILKEWNSNIHDLLIQSGALFVDKKTTYVKELQTPLNPHSFSYSTISYKNKNLTSDLINLTYASGIYSRFFVDKGFSDDQFTKLYFEWLNKSVNGEFADQVWVTLDNEKIVGFLTTKIKNKSGQIGLLAVSEEYRGKGIGKSLLKICEEWYFANQLEKARVVTQGDNTPACKLYEALGYRVESVEYYYHLWNK